MQIIDLIKDFWSDKKMKTHLICIAWRSCFIHYWKTEMTKQIKLFEKQTEVFDVLTDQENWILELLIGWGAGGSKTFTWCLRLITSALNNPWTRRGLGRSKLKTLRTTTLRTMTSILNKYFNFKEGYHYKITWSNDVERPNCLIFAEQFGWSEIIFVDLKYYPSLDPDFDDLWSLELTGGFIDEVVQITQKAYQVFSSRIGRRRNEELKIKPALLMSCNPWKNRVYNDFYRPMKAGTIEAHKMFIQILWSDNPYCPKDYLYKLSIMPDWPMKQRLFFWNRDYGDDTNKVYSYRDLQSIFTNQWLKTGEKYIICDVAGAWRDKAIVTVWDWRTIIDRVVEMKSTPESIKAIMIQKGNEHIVKRQNRLYDWSWLWRWLSWLDCQIFQWGWSPIETADQSEQEKEAIKKTYKNLRSQCFFMLARWIRDWSLAINCVDDQERQEIIDELDTIQYWNIEKDWPLQCIPKDKIKKLIWRSPDRADTISMRVYFELIQEATPCFA